MVGEVRDELSRRVDAVIGAGVDPDCIVLDPGLGFGKRPEHNWPLLAHLADVAQLAGGTFPVLVGASRKRFLGNLLAGPDGTPRSFEECDGATVAVTELVTVSMTTTWPSRWSSCPASRPFLPFRSWPKNMVTYSSS